MGHGHKQVHGHDTGHDDGHGGSGHGSAGHGSAGHGSTHGHGHDAGHGHSSGPSFGLLAIAVAVVAYVFGWASRPSQVTAMAYAQNAGPGYFEPLPAQGPVDSPVLVVEVLDFKCGACKARHGFVKRLLAEHGRSVRFAVRHLPFVHPIESERGAIASMAANRQGRFWDYSDMLFRNQDETWTDATLTGYAQRLGLDPVRFAADLRDPSLRSYVRKDKGAADAVDIRGTPTLIVNGRVVPEDALFREDPAVFRDMVAAARRATTELIASGLAVPEARARDASRHYRSGRDFPRLFMLNDVSDLKVDLRSL
ncbi:MAG: thioredoxin domain-containing protein [Myxococcales bacterium]|nr:thioredoxin domain-containing protein [Myxococcales bacterium]